MDPALHIAIIIFCIIMSAYFSATETAFSTFNRIRIKNLAEKGNKRSALVLKLADNYDTLISTILIGNNIVNILASSMATLLFIHIVKDNDLGSLLSTIVLTVVILVFGEISPKTVAKKLPESFAMFSAPMINLLLIIFFPLSIIFKGLQSLLGRIFMGDSDEKLRRVYLTNEMVPYYRKLIAMRKHFYGQIGIGEMLRPPGVKSNLPPTKEKIEKANIEYPAVTASAWRSADGVPCAFFTNHTAKTAEFTFKLDKTEFPGTPKHWLIADGEGKLHKQPFTGNKLILEPLGVAALEFCTGNKVRK